MLADDAVNLLDQFVDALDALTAKNVLLVVGLYFHLVFRNFLAVVVHVQLHFVLYNLCLHIFVRKVKLPSFSVQTQNSRFEIPEKHLLLQNC